MYGWKRENVKTTRTDSHTCTGEKGKSENRPYGQAYMYGWKRENEKTPV